MITLPLPGIRVTWPILFSLFVPCSVTAQGANLNYQVVKRIEVADSRSGFLTVDNQRRRLFGAGNGTVVDIDKDTIIAAVPFFASAVSVVPDLARGVTTEGIVFDLIALKPLTPAAKTLATAGGTAYDPVTHRAFLFGPDTTLVIDPRDGTVIGRIPVLAGYAHAAVADGHGRVYVNLTGKNSLMMIDARKMAIEATWPLGACKQPAALSMDRSSRRLFVSCHDSLFVVVDADNGRLIQTMQTRGWAFENAFDPGTRLIFNPDGGGTMTIVHEDSPNQYSVSQIVETADAQRAVAVDERTHRAFLYHRRESDTENSTTVIVLSPSAQSGF